MVPYRITEARRSGGGKLLALDAWTATEVQRFVASNRYGERFVLDIGPFSSSARNLKETE